VLPERLDQRVSDAEREEAVATLRDQCGAGRLSLDECADRMARALAATNGHDLAALTADLPAAVTPRPPAGRWVVGVFGGEHRRGRWRLGDRLTAVATFGSCEIDLRHAERHPGPEPAVTAVAVFGSVELVVPAGTEVELRGMSFLGTRTVRVKAAEAGGEVPPALRLRGVAVLGSVQVVSRRPVP
jgi:Domain of unknown function (DUF1707)